jgi:hypothetical protein
VFDCWGTLIYEVRRVLDLNPFGLVWAEDENIVFLLSDIENACKYVQVLVVDDH